MLSFFSQVPHQYLYFIIYLAHIPLAGLVLIPSIYLTIHGTLNLFFVYLAIILSSATSDSVWYYIGSHISKERIYQMKYIRSKLDEAKQFSSFFTKHGVLLVFLTKFIAGTRLTSHILAGSHKINYFKFLLSTMAGSSVWFAIFYLLIKSLDMSVANVSDIGKRIQIIFLVATIVLVAVNYITAKLFRKKVLKKNAR